MEFNIHRRDSAHVCCNDTNETDFNVNLMEEYRVARELHQKCVEVDGQWHERDPTETAYCFHELGKLYASRDDKRSLISAAGLLMAAVVRGTPDLVEVKQDLKTLWCKILHDSSAAEKEGNIETITCRVKQLVSDMRETARTQLNLIPQISDNENKRKSEMEKIRLVRELQSATNAKFVAMLKEISDYCTRTLFGEKAIDFALLVLGSLSREEASPYSDIESVIVIPDDVGDDVLEDVIDRFRWYAVMFQVIIISLGESPVRLLGIKSLNDFYSGDTEDDWFYDKFTKSGIQFDSDMPFASIFPLGRRETVEKPFKAELIRRVSDMVEYVDRDFESANGYHLSDVLANSKFVAGTEKLHTEFIELINLKMGMQTDRILFRIRRTVKYFDSFDILSKQQEFGNIKGLMYRLIPLLIGYISSLFSITANSCFDAIAQLVKAGVISQAAGHNLSYALAVAGEVRWKVYERAGEQVSVVGIIQSSRSYASDENSELFSTVGQTSIIDFFDITRCFWNVLVPVIRNQSSMPDISQMRLRGSSEVAMAALYTSLHLPRKSTKTFDRIEPLQNPTANEVQDVVHIIAMSVDTMFDLMNSINHLFSSYEEEKVRTTDIMDALTHSYRQLLIGLKISKAGFIDKHPVPTQTIFSDIFGEDYHHPAMGEILTSLEKLQKTVQGFFKDPFAISNLPCFFIMAYLLANFTTALQFFRRELTDGELVSNDTEDIFGKLNEVMQHVENLTTELRSYYPSLNHFHVTGNARELAIKWLQKAPPGLSSYATASKRWSEEFVQAKRSLLSSKLTKFQFALNKLNDVTRFFQGVSDWSLLVGLVGDIVIRDLESVLQEILRIKADFLFRNKRFAQAQPLYENELSIVLKNSGTRGSYHALVAASKMAIAICVLEQGNFTKALGIFRDELSYRLENTAKRTSANEIAENFINQSRCLSGIGEQLEANFYFATAGDILRRGIWTKHDFV